MKQENIYKVVFREPPLTEQPTKTEFYFGSLAAIYEQFTPEQIGCKVENLWRHGIESDNPYKNGKCCIIREVLTRKAQKRASRK